MGIRSITITMVLGMALAACAPVAGIEDTTERTSAELTREDELAVRSRVPALSADPLLERWIQIAVHTAAVRTVALRRMGEAELAAHAALVSDFPRVREQYTPESFHAAFGLDPAIIDAQGAIYARLDQRYGLAALSRAARHDLFARAIARYSRERHAVEGMIEYELHRIEDDGSPEPSDACIEDCQLRYTVAAVAALQAYIASLAAATIAGPAWPILVASATAAYFYALAEAQQANEDCIAFCEGTPAEDFCEDDADCAPDGFCWTGVLGVGINECRPLKDEGQTCSRHGQCESGCCRLHLPTNPVSRVCRPSDRC